VGERRPSWPAGPRREREGKAGPGGKENWKEKRRRERKGFGIIQIWRI
jgi:hypothetical protein